jgi:hypothetical protein
MAWAGKSLGEICVQIKDTDRNGGMPRIRWWVGAGILERDGLLLRERSSSLGR